jgi:hypothetical protein
LSFIHRGAVGSAALKNLAAFDGLGQTAVPTGEAHRLPKKCAFLSARSRQVKGKFKQKHCRPFQLLPQIEMVTLMHGFKLFGCPVLRRQRKSRP